MPNHYHLLVSAVNDDMANISLFMKKLNKGYAQHFNHKYDRSGALWEGKYKKVHIVRDNHFLYIPYYIHLNPLDLYMPEWRHGAVKNTKKALKYLSEYRWSSHLDYMNKKNFSSILNMEVWDKEHPLRSRRKYEQELISIMTRQNLAEQSSRLE
jgi:putative transposase